MMSDDIFVIFHRNISEFQNNQCSVINKKRISGFEKKKGTLDERDLQEGDIGREDLGLLDFSSCGAAYRISTILVSPT
ncbi:MAG: hypothetical protein N2A40_01960 [Desulfobulbaceae bacterium]